MRGNNESMWHKYKTDFLQANHCTVDEFEAAYLAFMGSCGKKPNTKAYRQFARKWGITIHPEPGLPEDIRAALSVNIVAIKVMAESSTEAEAAIEDILAHLKQ